VTGAGPTAFWRFEELGGSTLADATGHGHTLTMPSVTFGAPGATGGAATGLNVTNGRATMTPLDYTSTLTGASFEFWIKPQVQGTPDGYGTLLVDDVDQGVGFYLKDNGSGGVNLSAFFTGDQLNTTTLKTDGTLYHVVAVVDNVGNGKWYVNGAQDGTFTWGAAFLNRFFDNDTTELLHVSLIDDVALYATALSGPTVGTHYTAGLAGDPAAYSTTVLGDSPVTYWKFDETSGSTLADATGHGHTLTMPAVTFGVPGALVGTTGIGVTHGLASMDPIDFTSTPTGASFEFWIKPQVQGTPDGYGTLLVDDVNAGVGFYLKDNGSGGVHLSAYFTGDQLNNTTLATDGTLYHIVAVVDNVGNGKWYVNGAQDGTFTWGAAMLNRFFDNDTPELLHVSLIDYIAIYPTALSASTVAAHYSLLGQNTATTVTLSAGDAMSCTIDNVDQRARLKLQKVVTNDNGGTLQATDFWLASTRCSSRTSRATRRGRGAATSGR
jgi:hypothetical protein